MRLFLAIELPRELRSKLHKVGKKFSKTVVGSFVAEPNIHITLKFLGDVPADKLDIVKEYLSRVQFEPFECNLHGLGAFPDVAKPRVLWVGVSMGSKETTKLSEDLNKVLEPLGAEVDTRFHPHVTLARVKQVTNRRDVMRLFEENKTKSFGSFRVERFSLVKSELTRVGPRYTTIATF